MSVELIREAPRRVLVGNRANRVRTNALRQVIGANIEVTVRHLAKNVPLLAKNARCLEVVARRRHGQLVLTAAGRIVLRSRKRLRVVANLRQPTMSTGMNLRAGFGTMKTRRNLLLPNHDLCPQILTTML